MLPYSLKVAWVVLSITGLMSCWITLMAFSRAIGTYWALLTYCIACTVMQGIFCLGFIWRMNPYEMPRGFCIAQSVVIASAAYVMASIASACSGAISLTVLSPKGWSNAGQAMLSWRRIFILPVIVFPIVATVIHVMLIYKFNAVQPTNDLHCDDTHPEWVRLFGYAAMPFILSIPCAVLSIKALIAVHKTNQAFRRAQLAGGGGNLLSSGMKSIEGMLKSGAPTSLHPSDNIPPPPPAAVPSFSRYRIPFLSRAAKDYQPTSFGSSKRRTSSVSTTIPVFKVPVNVRTAENQGPSTGELDKPKPALGAHEHGPEEEKNDERLQDHDANDGFEEIHDRDPVESRDFDLDPSALNVGRNLEENIGTTYTSSHSRRMTGKLCSVEERTKYRWPPPTLGPAFWRIMLFQVAYTLVQVLACISTIIDVAKHRPQPTPFGMQHIALQLSAWGPFFIFGHLPAVRRNLFWRR
ncbi:hypothetical protein F5887DRAFT_1228293, partial [Amanita rubescens]